MKTFTSFRATTRNPVLNLISRLIAIFGMVMMFAVSGWGAQAPVMSPDTMSAAITTTTSNGTTIADVNATDADGDTLTYSIGSGNSSGAFTINSSSGIITVADNTRLTVTTYTLSVEVKDGTFTGFTPRKDTGTVTVTVTIAPTAPTLTTSIPDQVLTVNAAMVALDLGNYFTDANGNPITYTFSPALPAGLSYDSTTHIISGTPTTAMTLTNFTVTAADNITGSVSDVFSITVTAAPIPATTTELCYENPQSSGFFMFFNRDLIPIKYIGTSTALSDVVVEYAISGFDILTFNSEIGIDDVEKTLALDGDEAEKESGFGVNFGHGMPNFSLFNKGITYHLGNMPSGGTTHNVWTREFFSLTGWLFSSFKLYADYTKDGINYRTILNPCPGNTVSVPTVNIADASMPSPAVDTNMSFTVTLSGSLSAQFGTESYIHYKTVDGNVTAAIDYVAVDNTLVVPAGQTTATIYVTIKAGARVGSFNLILDNAYGASVSDGTAVGTITAGGGGVNASPAYGDCIDTSITTSTHSTAYNDSTDTGSSVGNPVSSSLKFLRTKIAGKTVAITTVRLNSLGVNVDYNNGGQNIDKALWIAIPVLNDITMTGACPAPTGNSSQLQQLIDPSTGKQAVFVIKDTGSSDYSATKNVIIPASASKNAKIELIVVDTSTMNADAQNCVQVSAINGNLEGLGQCVNAEVHYVDAYGQTAYDRCAVSTTYGKPCLPANGGVGTGLFASSLGCLMCTFYAGTVCSTDNFAIRPEKLAITKTTNLNNVYPNLLRSGEDYNTTIKAYNNASVTPTNYYNVSNANSTFVIAAKMYDKNNVERNATTTPSMAGSASFAASDFNMSNGVSIKLGVNEVAGLSFDNVGKVNLNIQDRTWSAVDNDDTPMNCDANGTYICGDLNATFIPYNFNFQDLNITNNNGNPGSFTYLANEFTKMGGRINTQMIARNKAGGTTTNFSPSPLWENNVTVVPSVVKSTYLYADANESNISNLAIGFSGGVKTIAWNETNTSQFLRFNFRRDVNLPQNSFVVNGNDLNITLKSNYIDPDGIALPVDINGSRLGTGVSNLPYAVISPADGNSTFVYGRIIPRDIRTFGTGVFTANGWYEVFNSPKIGTTNLPASKNDSSWYTNTLHNDVSDGDANVTAVVTTTSTTLPVSSISNATGIESYLFNAETPPYGAKAHIDTDPWLWYGTNVSSYLDPANPANLDCMTHPCFNINVVPAVGATGSAITGSEANKASKKSTNSAGAGGWKSTSDYAPAVR